MIYVLGVLGYLVVGFIAAVLWERYGWSPDGTGVALMFISWPITGPVVALLCVGEWFVPFVQRCARRIP